MFTNTRTSLGSVFNTAVLCIFLCFTYKMTQRKQNKVNFQARLCAFTVLSEALWHIEITVRFMYNIVLKVSIWFSFK